MFYLEENISLKMRKIRYNGVFDLKAMISCDMIISNQQVECYFGKQFKLLKFYLSELCQVELDLMTFK